MRTQICEPTKSNVLASNVTNADARHQVIGVAEPVPCQVELSDEADVDFLSTFKYIQACLSPAEHTLLDCQGCCCRSPCQGSTTSCSCFSEYQRGLQALKQEGRPAGLVRLLECGPACACDITCPARNTQQGVSVKLALHWDSRKGWCVKALQHILQGTFVVEYVGEYVSGAEAARRLDVYDTAPRGHALLVVRVHLPSQTSCLYCCIDATSTGNLARFINHSCDGGNLEPIITSSRGSILPRVALFAAHDIHPGEELSFSYAVSEADSGIQDAGGRSNPGGASARPCLCGSSACCGFLPRVV